MSNQNTWRWLLYLPPASSKRAICCTLHPSAFHSAQRDEGGSRLVHVHHHHHHRYGLRRVLVFEGWSMCYLQGDRNSLLRGYRTECVRKRLQRRRRMLSSSEEIVWACHIFVFCNRWGRKNLKSTNHPHPQQNLAPISSHLLATHSSHQPCSLARSLLPPLQPNREKILHERTN